MSLTETMVLKFHKKLKNLKKALTSLKHEKNSKRHSNQELRRTLDIFSEENSSLNAQLKEKEEELLKLSLENLTLKEDLVSKSTFFEEDKRFLYEEIRILKNEKNEMQKELEKTRQENIFLKKEQNIREILIKEQYEKNEALLKEEKNKLEEEISQLKHDLAEYETRQALIKKQCENNEALFKEDKNKLEQEILQLKQDKVERKVQNKFVHLVPKCERDSRKLSEEVESLKSVLELKQNEIKNMRKALDEAKLKDEALEVIVDRVHQYRTKCEDLKEQLNRKCESERSLENEIEKLKKIAFEENTQNRRLSYQNEELQWRMSHTKKVVTRACDSSDQSERSPQKSPTSVGVKRVVRKRQSLGYVLDLDECPEKIEKSKIQTGRVGKAKLAKGKINRKVTSVVEKA